MRSEASNVSDKNLRLVSKQRDDGGVYGGASNINVASYVDNLETLREEGHEFEDVNERSPLAAN